MWFKHTISVLLASYGAAPFGKVTMDILSLLKPGRIPKIEPIISGRAIPIPTMILIALESFRSGLRNIPLKRKTVYTLIVNNNLREVKV
ncbi:MAG: hypothetical protein NTV68_00790 [Methanomicrobiales archaeon]|nr:hypothetical protein [Methanomicrobiales archaeon]